MLKELSYIVALLRSVFRRNPSAAARRGRTPRPILLVALLLAAAAWTVTDAAGRADDMAPGATAPLQLRAERMVAHFDRAAALHADEVAPLERVLVSQGAEPPLARRVATALVAEARRNRLEPRLLLGVMLVENPWIDPAARSPVGARGLMQVMPFHEGRWGDCAPRLDDVEANICHGARIFAAHLKAEEGNIERALLRYNGCVRGTNTPNCHAYPNHVLARTGRVTLHDWRAARVGMAAAP